MKWEIPLSASVASTSLVLVLDVLALWLIDVSLVQIAAYLNALEICDRQNAVEISDVLFESLTGRSHGPMWFRKAQVGLKVVLLACSIAVGLSINAFEYRLSVPVPYQTVLVNRKRGMAQLGIGNPPFMDLAQNFSSDVTFVLLATGECFSAVISATSGKTTRVHWNASPSMEFLPAQYSRNFSIVCLQKREEPPNDDFHAPPLIRREELWESISRKDLLQCAPKLPTLSEIQSGIFTISISKCPRRLTHYHCQAKHRRGCALTLELGKYQVLETFDYNSRQTPPVPEISNYMYKPLTAADAERFPLPIETF